jgi:hypothetical protein
MVALAAGVGASVQPAAAATSTLRVSSADEAALNLSVARVLFSTEAAKATPAKAVTFTNSGTVSVSVSGLAVTGTNATSFKLATGQATSFTIAAGKSVTASVLFTPTADTGCTNTVTANVVRLATLSFTTTASGFSSASDPQLAGLNACGYEGAYEPTLGQMVKTFGYTTQVTPTATDTRYLGPTRIVKGSDEVAVPYFVRASTAAPVTLTPLAHYEGATTSTFGNTGWYPKGTAALTAPCSAADKCTQLFSFPADAGTGSYTQNQKLDPTVNSGGTTTFTPSGSFGLYNGIGASWSTLFTDDGGNTAVDTADKAISPAHYIHGFRVYPAYGPGRVRIANTWLIATDVTRQPAYKNNDFQDMVWVLKNAAPAVTAGSAPGASALSLDLTKGGTVSSSCAVTGFSGVLAQSNTTACVPSHIAFGTTGLSLTSASGEMANTKNAQQDALYKTFDATKGSFTVTARVVGPVTNLKSNYQQIAAFFGPDQDNYVKVETEYNSSESGSNPHLSMWLEQGGAGKVLATVPLPAVTTAKTVDLIIKGNTNLADPISTASDPYDVHGYPLDEVEAFYSINGATPVQVGTYALPTKVVSWFAANAKAGIFVTGGGSATSFSKAFSSLKITSGW